MINIKTVITDENINELFRLNQLITEDIQADTHDLMLLKGAEIQHADYLFDYKDAFKEYEAYEYQNFEKLIDQLNLIREKNIKSNTKAFLHPNIIPLNTNDKITHDKYMFLNEKKHNPKNFKTCLSPWTSVHVNVDGNVFPCMAFSIGNVTSSSTE